MLFFFTTFIFFIFGLATNIKITPKSDSNDGGPIFNVYWGDIFCWNFCFRVVKPLMLILLLLPKKSILNDQKKRPMLLSYLTCPLLLCLQYPINPVPDSYVEMIPSQSGQSFSLTHRLMAPPAAPQVSGRAIQTSVWIPRSIHCLFLLSVATAEFVLKS